MRKQLDRRILAGLIFCALGSACTDTDTLHVGLRTSEFLCSGAPVAQNVTALVCGSSAGGDLMEIMVVVGGPTTSTVIKGLHFDVVYPRDRFAYVAGSAAMIADNFLTWGGGTCNLMTSTCSAGKVGAACTQNRQCNIPGVVTPVVTAAETLDPPPDPTEPLIVPGRLRITIDRVPATGVGATLGGPNQVLRFQLQAVSVTEPIDPTLLRFQNAAAVNPTDTPIASVLFNNQLLLWLQ